MMAALDRPWGTSVQPLAPRLIMVSELVAELVRVGLGLEPLAGAGLFWGGLDVLQPRRAAR
jgi:hypothetical protein